MLQQLDKREYFKKLKEFRAFYQKNESKIIDTAKAAPHLWYISYLTDYSKVFTPIEMDAWNTIRCKGRIVLYPQYPVDKYQVDFGNPYFKIALELDGKEWHKDKEKDQKRDEHLSYLGWTTFRVTGREMARTDFPELPDIENGDRDEIIDWILNTGDGVIESIKQIYFLRHKHDDDDWLLAYCKSSLYIHQHWGRTPSELL